jgi:hypothetical protein
MEAQSLNKIKIMNYKALSFAVILIAASSIIACYGFNQKNEKKEQSSNAMSKGFAVVELFTSEGCSSCPPADEAVADLLSKNNEDVFILTYHVDYWNRLGWKDEFSKPEYSARQTLYARYLSLDQIYTPQAIVNGTHQFVGSNQNKLNNTVTKSLQNNQTSNLKITAQKAGNMVTVNYNIAGDDAVILNTALVQTKAVTAVKRGENGGRTLKHVNIVRELKTFEAKGAGKVIIDIPGELNALPLQVISYTQLKKNFRVTGADKANF